MSENQGLRPLYLVNELAQAVGEEITYAYDDLAFISHSEVLIQFTDSSDNSLNLYLHQDLNAAEFQEKKQKWLVTASELGTLLSFKGRFSMDPCEESDEIDLRFFPEQSSDVCTE